RIVSAGRTIAAAGGRRVPVCAWAEWLPASAPATVALAPTRMRRRGIDLSIMTLILQRSHRPVRGNVAGLYCRCRHCRVRWRADQAAPIAPCLTLPGVRR